MSSEPFWNLLVDSSELVDALGRDDLRIVDVRASASAAAEPTLAIEREFAHSHLPGALHADLNRHLSDLSRAGEGRHPLPDSATFAATLGHWGITPQTQVVAYDAGDGSMAAARLWWMLRALGHRKVAVLDGGLASWRAAALPETGELAVPESVDAYPGRFSEAAIAPVEEVQRRLVDPEGWLLDARAGERFRGDVEPIDRVAGHVPGAVNRPLGLNVRDGRLRPVAELRAELQPLLGQYRPEQAVAMCGSGVTACHLILALELAGLSGVRLYPGSWSGWICDSLRPVATS